MASKKYEPIEGNIVGVFDNIDFRDVEFSCRLFYSCIFRNCNFEDIYFYSCAFKSCKFINCNLKKTGWDGVSMDQVEFTESALIGSVFNSPHIVSTIFGQCSLRGAAFRNFHFYESVFYGNILCDAVFRFGYFIDSKISSVLYKRKCPEDSELSLVTKPYKGAIFINIGFNESGFNHIDFNKFDMLHCSFIGCTFDSFCKNIPYIPMTCPEEGSFIAYKKVLTNPFGSLENSTAIAVLEIPADAKRSSGAGTRKCRCNKAKVLRFEDLDGNVLNEFTNGYSYYNNRFIYHVGEYVTEDNFDKNRWEQCSKGIHFFMNRREAVNYNFN